MTEVSRETEEAEFFEAMRLSSEAGLALRDRMNTIPIIGGVLCEAGLHLATFVSAKSGLHAVRFMVVHPEILFAVGMGSSAAEALSMARKSVTTLGLLKILTFAERLKRDIEEKAREKRQARADLTRDVLQERVGPKVRSIPKRRKKIFDASNGQCHYCATPLTLDGKWHIEHKMPKALMGGNEPSNLVASCVKCNHEKRDLTDVEFAAKRGVA